MPKKGTNVLKSHNTIIYAILKKSNQMPFLFLLFVTIYCYYALFIKFTSYKAKISLSCSHIRDCPFSINQLRRFSLKFPYRIFCIIIGIDNFPYFNKVTIITIDLYFCPFSHFFTQNRLTQWRINTDHSL